MSKTYKSTCAFMCILLLCLFSLVLFFSPGKKSAELPPLEQAMVLRDFRGQLALFKEGETEPVRVFDTYVSSLPPLDRQRLSGGIPVKDGEDLWGLLQDFDR